MGAFIVSLALASACGGDRAVAPDSGSDIRQAARQFDSVATSYQLSGDTIAAVPYRDAADMVRHAGRLTSITIAIDGVPTPFLAVAQRVRFDRPTVCAVPGPLPGGVIGGGVGSGSGDVFPTLPVIPVDCFRLLGRPNLVAWEKEGKHRTLLVVGPPDRIIFGAGVRPLPPGPPTVPPPGGALPPVPVASLAFASLFDRDGDLWWATGGTGENHLLNVGEPCDPQPRLAPLAVATCNRATFSWQLDVGMEPVPLMRPGIGATGSPRLVLAKQEIAGALFRISQLPPPPPPPPGPPPPLFRFKVGLDARLDGTDIVFTLRVTNATDSPIELRFPTSEQIDFVVRDGLGGSTLWSFSGTRVFQGVVTERTIGARETVTYTERWEKATARGHVLVIGKLTSSNYPVEIGIPLDLP